MNTSSIRSDSIKSELFRQRITVSWEEYTPQDAKLSCHIRSPLWAMIGFVSLPVILTVAAYLMGHYLHNNMGQSAWRGLLFFPITLIGIIGFITVFTSIGDFLSHPPELHAQWYPYRA